MSDLRDDRFEPTEFEPTPVEPAETEELEEQEVLRSWSERLAALRPDDAHTEVATEAETEVEDEAQTQPMAAASPEPEPEPTPNLFATSSEEDDEDDVLKSWSERLAAFQATEPEPAAAPEPAPTLQHELPPEPEPASHAPARPRVKPVRRPRAHRRVVGLKIGGSQIAVATVSNNGDAELVQLAREPLPAGVVVAGEVREPVVLGEALKAFFAKHKLPKKDVRLGLAANRIGVRTFALPDVPDPQQRENAILFRAQEVLPIPVHEAVLDYHVLDADFGEEESPRVLLVVAYRELVDGFLEACEIAELTLTGIDLEAFALLRALGSPEEAHTRTGAHVAVAVGHHRSTVAVSNGRVCEFTRVIDWGGDTLDVAIARTLNLTPQEVAPLKHTLSLTRRDAAAPEEQAVIDAVTNEIHSFTRDLVSSLHYYQSQPGALEIADIALTGGTAHLPGFAEELQRLIGVDVHVADPLRRVRVGKKVEIDEDELGSLTIAIGLGIED